jgi:hypothetical protein
MSQKTLGPVLYDRIIDMWEYLEPAIKGGSYQSGGAPVLSSEEAAVYYVEESGSDTQGDGLSVATAKRNVQSIVNNLPRVLFHDVDIYMGAGSFDGFKIQGIQCIGCAIHVHGAPKAAPTGLTGATSGTAEAGSSAYVIVDSAANWAVDELVDKWVDVAGERMPVHHNTADTIYLSCYFSASTTGKSYSILENKTIIDGTPASSGSITVCAYVSGHLSNSSESVVFEDLTFDAATAGALVGVGFYGSQGGLITDCNAIGGYYGALWQGGNEININGLVVADSILVGLIMIRMGSVRVFEKISVHGVNTGSGVGVSISDAGAINGQTMSVWDNVVGCQLLETRWMDVDAGFFNDNGVAFLLGAGDTNANDAVVLSLTSSRYEFDGCGKALQMFSESYAMAANLSGTVTGDFAIEVDQGSTLHLIGSANTVTGALGMLTLDGATPIDSADIEVGKGAENTVTKSSVYKRAGATYYAGQLLAHRPSTETIKDLIVYVRTDGDDTNGGLVDSAAGAKATIQGALEAIAKQAMHNVLISVGAGSFEGFHIDNFELAYGKRFTIRGTTAAPTLSTGTASGTATGGSGPSGNTLGTIVDSGQAWTVDELKGMKVNILGTFRNIVSNTADTISYAGGSPGTVTGEAYTITERLTVLDQFPTSHHYGYIEGTGNKLASSGEAAYKASMGFWVEDFVCDGQGGFYEAAWIQHSDPINLSGIVSDTPYWGIGFQHVHKRLFMDNCWVNDSFATTLSSGNIYAFFFDEVQASNCYVENANANGYFLTSGKAAFVTSCVSDNAQNGVVFENLPLGIVSGGSHHDNKVNGILGKIGSVQVQSGVDCSDNAGDGVQLIQNAQGVLGIVTGSGNGGDGVKVRLGSGATINASTAVTGTGGDVQVDQTAATYAGDFAANGSSVFDSKTGCWVQRED